MTNIWELKETFKMSNTKQTRNFHLCSRVTAWNFGRWCIVIIWFVYFILVNCDLPTNCRCKIASNSTIYVCYCTWALIKYNNNQCYIDIFSLLSRYVSPVDSEYYEGTGYSKVVIDKKYIVLFISMSVYSRSENGLLLYIGTEVQDLSHSSFLNLTSRGLAQIK